MKWNLFFYRAFKIIELFLEIKRITKTPEGEIVSSTHIQKRTAHELSILADNKYFDKNQNFQFITKRVMIC